MDGAATAAPLMFRQDERFLSLEMSNQPQNDL
jgi:hypothetical protein